MDQPAHQITVDQKVLPESFPRAHAGCGEQRRDLPLGLNVLSVQAASATSKRQNAKKSKSQNNRIPRVLRFDVLTFRLFSVSS